MFRFFYKDNFNIFLELYNVGLFNKYFDAPTLQVVLLYTE